MRTTTTKLATGILSLALLTGLTAACGDDDDDATAVRPPAEEATAGNDAGGTEAVCAGAAELTQAMARIPRDGDAARYVGTEVLPVAENIAEALPAHLAEAGTDLTGALGDLADSGDPSIMGSPAFVGSQADIGAYVHDTCELEAIDVTAVDYDYQGLPEEITAGRVSFAMTNEGAEDHEIAVFKANPGVTESFEELSELPEEELMSKLTFTGVTFGSPGSTSYAVLDMDPGTYHLVCFVPVGGGEEGPPHFTQGMRRTITVA